MTRALLWVVMAAAAPALAQTPPPAASPVQPAATQSARPAAPSMLKPAEPAGDGTQPRQRLVTVFGTEPCPKPTSPDEVVVCARLPESEIYRIPPALRQAQTRTSVFQRNRSLLLGDASGGAGGSIGSCSTVGPGGLGGCTPRMVEDWAADRTNRMGYSEATPEQ